MRPPIGPALMIQIGRAGSAAPGTAFGFVKPSTVTATFGTVSVPGLRTATEKRAVSPRPCRRGNIALETWTL